MVKQNDRRELLRFGNFIIESISDKNGHVIFITLHTVSWNWQTKIDESTWLFGLIKSIVAMNPRKEETILWMNYLHSCVNILYQFGTCGIPIEVLTDINNSLKSYFDKIAKDKPAPSKDEEKATIDDLKREQEMKEEFINNNK